VSRFGPHFRKTDVGIGRFNHVDAAVMMKRVSTKSLWSWILLAALGGLPGACSDVTVPADESGSPEGPSRATSPLASAVVAEGPTEFTGIAGTSIASGPAVRVLDQSNRPLPGIAVTFVGQASKIVATDADGIARFGPLQLDTLAGAIAIQAQVKQTVRWDLNVLFHAQAVAGPLAQLTASSGNNQSGPPNKVLMNHLYAEATDRYHNRISGVEVAFSVISGGGAVQLSRDTTNAAGVATAGAWTLGSASVQRVRARAGNFEAVFDASLCGSANPCNAVPSDLAYVRDGGVWINRADGPFLVTANASRPAWSPDGSVLAFFKVNAGLEETQICLATEPFASVKCAPVDVLSREIASEMRIAWAPDGRTLALSRAYYGEGDTQLLFLDRATMTTTRHGTIDQQAWSASWSPDGTRMVIATDANVYLANAGGSELNVLLPYAVWDLSWSPDGQKIAMTTMSCAWECFGQDLMLFDLQTRETKLLERGGGFGAIAWSPDGSKIAYTGAANGMTEIRIRTIASGADDVVLTNASDPSWHP
jgi:hypothetical protein